MADILLKNSDGLYFDLEMKNNDLSLDLTLKTAIEISLFSDRRVSVDELPEGETDQRGWWADALNDDQDEIGSKLWLLKREKVTQNIVDRAREYCEEALQWLVTDQIAASVTVTTERQGLYQIAIGVGIQRPKDDRVKFRFGFIWESDQT